MRSFDERRDEIFRRSKQRIRTRQHAIRVALLCIPLFLCLTAAVLLPRLGTQVAPAMRVEVQQENGSFYKKSTDAEQVAALSTALKAAAAQSHDEFFQDYASDIGTTYTQQAVPNVSPTGGKTHATKAQESAETDGCYVITFFNREGERLIYRLRNRTLTAVNTATSILLSEETAAELHSLIRQLS